MMTIWHYGSLMLQYIYGDKASDGEKESVLDDF